MFLLIVLSACHRTTPSASTGDTGTATDSGGPTDTGTPPPPPAILPGELVITELMVDPSAVDDTDGEYIEVVSAADRPVELEGLEVTDDDGAGFFVFGSLVVQPGERIVLAPEADDRVNGGLTVAYDYPSAVVQLGEDNDAVLLLLDGVLIDGFTYEAQSISVIPGYAIQLAPQFGDAAANDAVEHWCLATSTYGDGDHGTPGAPNDPC